MTDVGSTCVSERWSGASSTQTPVGFIANAKPLVPPRRLTKGPLRDARQEAFCQNVARGALSLRQCAINAGYPAKYASITATRLRKRAAILARIADLEPSPATKPVGSPVPDAHQQRPMPHGRAEVVVGELVTEPMGPALRGASSDQILLEIDKLALSDIGQAFDLSSSYPRFLPMGQWPENLRRAVASLKVRESPVRAPDVNDADLEIMRAFADALEEAEYSGLPPGMAEPKTRVANLIRQMCDAMWNRVAVTEIKLWSKPQALQQAGNVRGLFKDLEKLSDAELARLEEQLVTNAIDRMRNRSRSRGFF